MSKRSKPNKFRAVIVVLLVILTAFILYKLYQSGNNNSNEDISAPSAAETEQASKVDSENKKAFIEKSEESQTEPTPTTSQIDLSANQENSNVTITAKMQGISSGTCELAITNGSKSVNKSAEIIYQPEFSSCAGFSIQKSELGSGNWAINLTAKGDLSNSKTIYYEVK